MKQTIITVLVFCSLALQGQRIAMAAMPNAGVSFEDRCFTINEAPLSYPFTRKLETVCVEFHEKSVVIGDQTFYGRWKTANYFWSGKQEILVRDGCLFVFDRGKNVKIYYL